MPSGHKHTVGYNMFSSTLSTQPDTHVGDIVYSRLFGKDIIIINSEKIAKDLLENRSRNYSDRPYMITTEMSVHHSLSYRQSQSIIQGVDWIFMPHYCLTAIYGGCRGGFSTRRFDSTQYPDFCPCNIARQIISSGSCSMPPNNLMTTYLSKCFVREGMQR